MDKIIMYSLLTVLLLLIESPIYGQEKFREGYIITLQQDTLYGLIDYKTASRSAEKCRFKNSTDSKVITYTPEQIVGYRFTPGKYYVAKSVKVYDQTRKVFLEYLIDGKVDIFFFRDELGDHYFAEEENGNMFPLSIIATTIERDGKTYQQYIEEYKRMLTYAFSDAPSLSDEVLKTKLSHASLIDIAEEYHNKVCDEYECVAYSREKSVVTIHFGVLVGGSLSTVSFSNVSSLRRFIEAPFQPSHNIIVGGFFNIYDPFVSEYLSLQLETWYGRGTYEAERLTLSHSYIKVPLMLRYTAISGKIRPTVAMGFANTFLFNVRDDQTFNKSGSRWLTNGRVLSGLEIAAGVNYKITEKRSLNSEIRYNLSYGTHSNNSFFNSRFTTFNIVTGISF